VGKILNRPNKLNTPLGYCCHCTDSACFAPHPAPTFSSPFPLHGPDGLVWVTPASSCYAEFCNLPCHPRGRHVSNPRMFFCPWPTYDVPPIGVYVSSIFGMCFSFFIFYFFCWGLVALLIL